MKYVISISSNFDSEKRIEEAKKMIEKTFLNVKFSREEITEPMGEGYPRERKFRNCAALFESVLDLDSLKECLRDEEIRAGRTQELRKQKVVPLDLDIIMVGDRIVHKDYERFGFLRKMIAELKPIF